MENMWCDDVRSGFTLIELSIVLVIIGLVVGGVLAGRELIKAAEIRGMVAQIEQYRTAVGTFKGKYGSLPGDISNAKATAFGLGARLGTTGLGDENGFIDACGNNASNAAACGETTFFWRDLATANLIGDAFTAHTTFGALVSISGAQRALNWPPAKIGNNNFVAVATSRSPGGLAPVIINNNLFCVRGINSVDISSLYNISNRMTPHEVFLVDTKLDDGMPLTGTTQYSDHTTALCSVAVGGTCVDGAGNYNVAASGNPMLCGFVAKMMF
jgi:prepilin-type N-terminal cleavage/methylation domain-containing protein